MSSSAYSVRSCFGIAGASIYIYIKFQKNVNSRHYIPATITACGRFFCAFSQYFKKNLS
nr:MAG TPA: hypothetical protein [Caudoviricetes sp.]